MAQLVSLLLGVLLMKNTQEQVVSAGLQPSNLLEAERNPCAGELVIVN